MKAKVYTYKYRTGHLENISFCGDLQHIWIYFMQK